MHGLVDVLLGEESYGSGRVRGGGAGGVGGVGGVGVPVKTLKLLRYSYSVRALNLTLCMGTSPREVLGSEEDTVGGGRRTVDGIEDLAKSGSGV